MSDEDDEGSIDEDVQIFNPVDKVTSEVNNFLVVESHLKPLHNPENVLARLRFTFPTNDNALKPLLLKCDFESQLHEKELKVDADGDIEVPRLSHISSRHGEEKRSMEGSIIIEYMNSTTLNLVAHQIWRGAFVLSDFILAHAQEYFQEKNVLELGSGTGLSGMVASLVASKVTLTDLDDPDILGLIEANLQHNKLLIRSEVILKPLDFLNLSWSPELEETVVNADIVIAADVVYHDKITDGFVRTLQKCFNTGKSKTAFIALEKRYVFTLSDLDVVAPAYDYFIKQMEIVFGISLEDAKAEENEAGGGQRSIADSRGKKFHWETIDLTEYPIYFNYEPSKDLVLWKIESERL